MTTLTKFSDCKTDAKQNDTSEVTVSGSPQHTAWPHFVSGDGTFRSGVWESTAGVFKGPMNNQIEFCHITEGEAKIVANGQETIVKAGDAFVMDNGLQPVWHVEKYVKKHFVIVSSSVNK